MNYSINCIIVEDEEASQNVLKHFISKLSYLNLINVFNNAISANTFLTSTSQKIDLIFLDINMPEINGVDFYKSLVTKPKVIFTTAYPNYAVEGFELNAVDYLLKPIPFNRFLTAINKIKEQENNDILNDNFIILKENKTIHNVKISDINYVEAYGDYIKVYTKSKTIITHSTFSKFLQNLPKTFLRIHKSYSVNLNKLQTISGNKLVIESEVLPIGQTYKKEVLKALNQ